MKTVIRHTILLSTLLTSIGSSRTVNFDFDDSQADLEVFQGVTANAEIDVNAQARTRIDAGVWMKITLTDASGTEVNGHVNDSGLGVIGNPGANQLSGGESIRLDFFDAASGGNPVNFSLNAIAFGNFGGTAAAAADDALRIETAALPAITINGNTNAAGSGWSYTQLNPSAGNGRGRIQFSPPIEIPTITLKDQSTGSGGSRLQQIDCVGSGGNPEPDPDPSAPNVIFIIADDMGYSDLGCYGGEIETPHIDSLAAQGIRMRQFYNNAKCETTRSCLMSGLYHGRSGLQVQNGATLGEAMRSGGYRTYVAGKWHLGDANSGRTPIDRGFHQFYGLYSGSSNYFPTAISATTVSLDTEEAGNFITPHGLSHFSQRSDHLSYQTSFPAGYYMTDAIGDHACAFISDSVANHPDRPFFLYLSFNAPHTPLQAPVPLINKYRNLYKAKGWDIMRQEKWQRQIDSGLVDPKWQLPTRREDIPAWDDLDAITQDREDHRRAVYAAMVDSMDQNVGKVLALLDTLEKTDNTLVIFCSDNGAQAFDNATLAQRQVDPNHPNSRWDPGSGWAAYSNTPFQYYKQAQDQGGICAPFVARWPDVIEPGRTTDEPAHIVDVMATLVDIGSCDYDSLTTNTGTPAPPMDGKSMLPIFDGTGRPAPDFWGFEFSDNCFAVIKEDWKLVSFRSGPWRLYNLTDDRTETRNLARRFPAKVQELSALYDQWAIDTYGNNSRIYSDRQTLPQLGDQHMRYENLATGELYSPVPIGFTVSNIGAGTSSDISEIHEYWTVKTTSGGIGGTSDACNFVSKPFFGDGELVVRLQSMEDAATALGGIMLRESFDADSAFVMTVVNSVGDCSMIHRARAAEPSASGPSITLAKPLFLRLTRRGNTFTSSCSADGLAWSTLSSQTLALGAKLQAGIASSSGSATAEASFIYQEWEQSDVAEYPEQSRLVDGVPQLLAYSFGADPETAVTNRLPTIRFAEDAGSRFPEMRIHQRIDLTGLTLDLEESSTLVPWMSTAATWTEVSSASLPDGITKVVDLRRDSAITDEARGFYRIRVEEP